MRSLRTKDIRSLKKLTDLRKAMLTAELATKKAALTQKKSEIEDMDSRQASCGAVSDQAAYALWQRWKRQELVRLNAEHALLRVSFDHCTRAVGRAVAEDSVVDHLKDISQAASKTRTRRQQEHTQSSHFLPHNIGDQNI